MLVTDPNLKNPRSAQWSLDLQRAIGNSVTLDVAYVGVHGWNEIHSIDLNEPALGSGWDATALFPVAGGASPCLGTNPASPIVPTQTSGITKCAADTILQRCVETVVRWDKAASEHHSAALKRVRWGRASPNNISPTPRLRNDL